MSEVTLNESQVKALKEIVGCEATNSNVKIAVLQRGWIVVGRYKEEGDFIILTNTSVIRRWGTTKGLGELAKNGALDGTVLDPCGTVRARKGTEVLLIDCEESKWLNL